MTHTQTARLDLDKIDVSSDERTGCDKRRGARLLCGNIGGHHSDLYGSGVTSHTMQIDSPTPSIAVLPWVAQPVAENVSFSQQKDTLKKLKGKKN
jgi:hypothetical protein